MKAKREAAASAKKREAALRKAEAATAKEAEAREAAEEEAAEKQARIAELEAELAALKTEHSSLKGQLKSVRDAKAASGVLPFGMVQDINLFYQSVPRSLLQKSGQKILLHMSYAGLQSALCAAYLGCGIQ